MKILAETRKIIPERCYRGLRKSYRFFRSCLCYGKKYECPFCHNTFRKMLADGRDAPGLEKIIGGRRHNAKCPGCSANDRERLVYLYLLYRTKLFSTPRVNILHIAPEENLSKKLRSIRGASYLSADLNSPAADIKMDVSNIRSRDDFFDAVICNHVLEHVEDDAKAMSEIFRVLKPGGQAILQVPLSTALNSTYEDGRVVDPKDRERKFGQKDHARIYELNDYKARLQNVGFKALVFKWSDDPKFSLIAGRFALNKEELLTSAVK